MVEIIDNFLDEDDFNSIKAIIEDRSFPWFFVDQIQNHEDKSSLRDYFFTHSIFDHGQPQTHEYYWRNIGLVVLKKLNPKLLLRLRVNLNTYSGDENWLTGWHVDYSKVDKYESAVLFLNTNDGATYVEGHEPIDAVENRLVIHGGKALHSGSLQTNTKARTLINICYN